jgi:hypothetical protein
MKTERLKRGDDGRYPDSIGASIRLTPQEARKVREVLAEGPIHLSALADSVGVPRTHAGKFSSLCHLVEVHLAQHTREAEMKFEQSAKGTKFVGWALTEQGKKLLEIS